MLDLINKGKWNKIEKLLDKNFKNVSLANGNYLHHYAVIESKLNIYFT